MALRRVSAKDLGEDQGIVYLLQIELDERTVVKIGVTSRMKIQDRVLEILGSLFIAYRVFPRIYPKRFTKTTEIYKKETMLHRYFADRQYTPEKVFSGCTECFDITLDEAVAVYERVLNGEDINESK